MADLTDSQQELAEKLTKLQRRVVINLVSGMSQRQAYYSAGGSAQTDAAADANVSRMLSDAKVSAFYESLTARAESDAVMSRQEALERLSKMARVSITDIAEFSEYQAGEDESGDPVMATSWRIKNSQDMSPEAASAIKSVTATKMGPKLELHDPAAAMKQLAELQGWNSATKHDHTSSDGSMSPAKYSDEELDRRIEQHMQALYGDQDGKD